MLCTATDVGIYGLLASQSCYHSMLAPCWFTLWTSSRFLYPYILLISLEIFLFSCHDVFRSTRQQRDRTTGGAIISEYSLVGEVTSGAAAALDDPSYAGVSNNQCLHLENAVTLEEETQLTAS